MADTTLTGAQTEVQVDTSNNKEQIKKLVIKVVIITLAVIATIWLYNKFVR